MSDKTLFAQKVFKKVLLLLKIAFLLMIPTAALILGFCRIIFDGSKILFLKDSQDIILILVSSLCIAFFIERELKFDELKNNFIKLKESIDIAIPTQYIGTREEILIAATELVQYATSRIDVLSFDILPNRGKYVDASKQKSGKEELAFSRYFESLIDKLQKTQSLELRITFGYTDNELTDTSIKIAEESYKKFKEKGVASQVNLRHRRLAPELTMLLIDKSYLFIAFPSLAQDSTPRNAIKFAINNNENNSSLIENLCRWYENYIWSEADEFKF